MYHVCTTNADTIGTEIREDVAVVFISKGSNASCLEEDFRKVILREIHFRTNSSEFPDTIDLLIPMLNCTVSVAVTRDGGKIEVCIALMCCTDLASDCDLRLGTDFVFGSSEEVLGADKWVPNEIGRADHGNEFFRIHAREALLSDNAVIHLSVQRVSPCLSL